MRKSSFVSRSLRHVVLGIVASAVTLSSYAQITARITKQISNSERSALTGSHPPLAKSVNDVGAVPLEMKLQGINIVFSRTPAQAVDLDALIKAQQDPTSPLYHQWLTPDEFAARFGMSDADIAKVQSWLEQQGFSVEGISRSKTRITFSGTAGQVQAAFGAPLHYYLMDGEKRYAPSTDLTIPAALSSVVQAVTNLSSFRPKPHVKVRANFTSSQSSGSHYLTPKDVATIYDVNAAYNAGYTGAGQSIAVVGQSAVVLSDIENFQNAAGLTVKDPIPVLVPGTGTSTVVSGDETESDLDLEYSGGIAKGATIYFVYTGNTSNNGVFDSIAYAVDTRLAPIISVSYGSCETALGSANYSSLNSTLQQAVAQGQSVIAASGDAGSTDCNISGYSSSLTAAQMQALTVDFPASSQYVTGLGGSEFTSTAVAPSNTTYWQSASGSDVISSALSYMPEQVWNDDSTANGLSAGGGGASVFTARPSWQTGVTGISSGSYRLVPDISLAASPHNAGYLYCSSDSNATGINGSCSNGFRDSNNVYLTVAGGTSFAAPVFAGMLAIINQKQNSTGQGLINSTLYSLASNSSTYASAFHDITSGSNACTAGTTYPTDKTNVTVSCSTASAAGYSAATGYDMATGLGSVDLYNLMNAWPASSSSSLAASTTTLSAANATTGLGTSDVITITVASGASSNTTTPTGTLTIVVDGTTQSSSLSLTGGKATYTFSSSTVGSHVIQATYSGDSTYAPSTGSVTVVVTAFTVSATNLTVSAGSSGTSTITVTPQNGYTGTIKWTVTTSSTLSNACYTVANTTVSGTSPVTATMTIYTSSSACASASVTGATGNRRLIGPGATISQNISHPSSRLNPTRTSIAMAGFLIVGLLGFRSRRLRMYSGIFCLVVISFAMSGCGGGSSSSSSSSSSSGSSGNASKGAYTLTVTGTDTSSSSITASTTMTLTIN